MARRTTARRSPALWFTALLSIACVGPVPLEWSGLEPLEAENRAPAPSVAGEPYPETLGIAWGVGPDFEWVHARGWVHGSVAEVWAAMAEPDTLVDRRRVDRWTHEPDVDSEVPVSFLTHHVVLDVVTVEFSLAWRQAHLLGTEEAPLEVLARSDLAVRTAFISLLSTTIRLEEVDGGITEIQLIRHIDALAAGAEDAEAYLWDLFASIVARVRGEALPDWT